ncbi:MAG: pectinesterase family protein, partial [Candidatus Promineifilaceae bacterium]
VAVGGGYFSVLLGSGSCTTGCPLGASTFSGTTRYLQTSVTTGGGTTTFPRQQLAAVPFALQATEAQTMAWSGLTSVPAGFADGTDDGATYDHVVTVAKSGGDFTSVASALSSITDSSSTNRYLVRVMPGVYTEASLVTVKSYVHVQGAGPNVTVITSSRSSGTPSNASATVDLLDNGRISNATVRNTGTGTFGIALYSAQTSRDAVVDNVVAEAIGTGGTGHYAAYWNDAEATIRNSSLFAGGAVGFGTAVNAGFGSVNISGGFPQALIENSKLIGGSNNFNENCNDPSGTGFGMQLSNSSPQVRTSYICGGHRSIGVYTNGNPIVESSSLKVSTSGSAFMFEITASGSLSIANSGISYLGNKFTGAGTGLRCVGNYNLGTWAALSNGTTTATACN